MQLEQLWDGDFQYSLSGRSIGSWSCTAQGDVPRRRSLPRHQHLLPRSRGSNLGVSPHRSWTGLDLRGSKPHH